MTWKKYKKSKFPLSEAEKGERRSLRLQKLIVPLLGLLISGAGIVYVFVTGKFTFQMTTFDQNTVLTLISTLVAVVSLYFTAFPPNLYSREIKSKAKDFKRFLPLHYIDIDCQDKNPADDVEQAPIRQSLREIVWDWLFDPDPRQTKKSFLLLLGDFGTGKTTFCYYMAQEIITTMHSMDAEVIQLGRENLSLKEKLNEIKVTARENTVLFLDAYDENSQRHSGEQEFDHFQELASNFYKVIITSRTHYFIQKEAEPHLATRYVSYFSEPQIQRFFKIKYPWCWKRYWNTIKGYENLTDLARRVVLLNYMSREVILWIQKQKSKNLEINAFKLYGKIVDEILPNEKGPHEFLSRDMAVEVMSILGFHIICCGGASRMHYQSMTKDLSNILHSLHMSDSKLAEYLDSSESFETLAGWLINEVRARTFLIRDEPGYYYFAHRSFAEYFAAVFIKERLLKAKAVINVQFQINRVILGLLKEAGVKIGDNLELFKKAEITIEDIASLLNDVSHIYREDGRRLAESDAKQMVKKNEFYDSDWNSSGKGIEHLYYEPTSIYKDKVVCDFATGLMWQQNGSTKGYWDGEYVRKLNNMKFAGYNDWRLPTLEEAMSLMEPKKHGNLYIDPVFDSKHRRIWTSDQSAAAPEGKIGSWVVFFDAGYCDFSYRIDYGQPSPSVRAVRSLPSSVE
ncbi:MAG: DUF1566 domain-containing protein [Desulfobacterales bacterium]|nr:DUF1566 domain-containing protein [Desulfobacterales bacterium]